MVPVLRKAGNNSSLPFCWVLFLAWVLSTIGKKERSKEVTGNG